jgi:hypothetical protein
MFGMDPVSLQEGLNSEFTLPLSEPHSPYSLSSLSPSSSASSGHYAASQSELFATTFGEHPLGEHPSRTLFVRNINSNVEDDELTSLFEVSIQSFQTFSHLFHSLQ